MKKRYEEKRNISNISKEEYSKKKEVVTTFFLNKEYMPLTFKQIVTFFDVKKDDIYIMEKILIDLENEGLIFVDDSKRYAICSKNNIFKCIYQAKSEKFGFGLIPKVACSALRNADPKIVKVLE